MQPQQWRGRGANLFIWIWLVPAFVFWLEKFDPLGPPVERGIPFFTAGLILFLVLWYTQRRFSLILDDYGLCYSTHFHHVHQPWSAIRSVKLLRGKLLLETREKVYRLELIGLSNDDAHNVLVCIQNRLPNPIRVVA